ncbi:bifunctional RNase H/acid phosphatase [Microbispora triticiradicis]|uniref:Bifunctional RNase H/acid phosphatase n=2 Tax=Microbispora triticiradicis TaxID=2200763 RepID=A0ABX9LHB8_9ACTN|nr:bifunctional RNase H/acid phosphatase [Microbispora triticiradicis]RGA03031.1 bifunctional RNase H/acid phosphatase [Microbispora triticiradicis]GLW20546.1 bifunctional RNase H/acid phosphatase [Microbispora amethystogenes]
MTGGYVVEADGGSRGNPGPAGYGAVVKDEAGHVLAEAAESIGTTTNNVAEYRGLIAGLESLLALGVEGARVEVRMDSKLVIEQMAGRWKVKHEGLRPLALEAAALARRLRVTWTWIPRERNTHADRLANEAMDAAARGETWRAGPATSAPRTPPPAGPAVGPGTDPSDPGTLFPAPASDDGTGAPGGTASAERGARPADRGARGTDSGGDRRARGTAGAAVSSANWGGDAAGGVAGPGGAAAGGVAGPGGDAAGGLAGSGGVAVADDRRGHGWMPGATRTATSLLLLRHGQTPLSIEKRFSGLGDPELTPTGLAQAEAAAARLARGPRRVEVIVTSPLARARQTAEAVASRTGSAVLVDEDLRETDFGAWEGYTFAEIQRRWPDELAAWLADPDVAPPGGESFASTARRVEEARERIVKAHESRSVVVVSHVTPIKTLIRFALGAPPEALYRMHLDLACLSAIDYYADGPSVVRTFNDTAHLG